jgi:hypothetical protein
MEWHRTVNSARTFACDHVGLSDSAAALASRALGGSTTGQKACIEWPDEEGICILLYTV